MSDQVLDFTMENLHADSYSIKKSALSCNYATITDIGGGSQGSYNSGLITYNNIQLTATDTGSVYSLQDALLHTQMQYTLSITGGTFEKTVGGGIVDSNINAVTKKSNNHFIHNTWAKFAGVDLNSNSGIGYANLYMNEMDKKRNPNLSYLENEQQQFYLDSVESFSADNVGLEANNASNTTGIYNKAIYQRNKYYIDTSASNTKMNFLNQSLFQTYYYPYFVNTTTALNWYDVLIMPLSKINSVYGSLPPVMHLNGFELKLQYNAGQSFQYQVVLNPTFQVQSESVQTQNGGTFPLMLSSGDSTGNSGLTLVPSGTGNITLTLTIQVGWPQFPNPTRILIPFYKLSNPAMDRIEKQEIFQFGCKHAEIDTTITGVTATQSVSRTLASHYRNIRRIYIIPFLSNQNKVGTTNILYPYQSARSSAPNTCSILRLKNFNILISGKSLFPQEQLNYETQFYDENFMHLNSEDYSMGNAQLNPLKSGSVLKYQWLNGYGVYIVDVDTTDLDASDDILKSIAVNWICDGNPTTNYLYDFFILVETERKYNVNALAGTLIPTSSVNQQ